MTSLPRTLALIITSGILLAGCAGKDFSDLDAFMTSKRDRPGGIIAPIPTFKAYEAFSYSATTLRSPFDRPVEVRVTHPPSPLFGQSLPVVCPRREQDETYWICRLPDGSTIRLPMGWTDHPEASAAAPAVWTGGRATPRSLRALISLLSALAGIPAPGQPRSLEVTYGRARAAVRCDSQSLRSADPLPALGGAASGADPGAGGDGATGTLSGEGTEGGGPR